MEAAGVNEATGAIIYYGEKQKKKRTLKDSGKKDETKKTKHFKGCTRLRAALFRIIFDTNCRLWYT